MPYRMAAEDSIAAARIRAGVTVVPYSRTTSAPERPLACQLSLPMETGRRRDYRHSGEDEAIALPSVA